MPKPSAVNNPVRQLERRVRSAIGREADRGAAPFKLRAEAAEPIWLKPKPFHPADCPCCTVHPPTNVQVEPPGTWILRCLLAMRKR